MRRIVFFHKLERYLVGNNHHLYSKAQHLNPRIRKEVWRKVDPILKSAVYRPENRIDQKTCIQSLEFPNRSRKVIRGELRLKCTLRILVPLLYFCAKSSTNSIYFEEL